MTIDFKEHKIKFGFGLYFLGKAQSDKGVDLNGLLQGIKNNVDIIDLMYISAKTEAYLDEVNLPFTRREFITHFEENSDFNKSIKDWELKFVESIKGHFLPSEEDIKEVEDSEKKN